MPIVNWTAESDRKLLLLLDPPTLKDRPLRKKAARCLAAKFAGATPKIINKRVIQLRREIKQISIPLTAPGQIEEPRTPSTNAAAAADANQRNLPPPGAPTPTFPRGPRSPKAFRSPITGEWFAIAVAPKRHKRMRGNSDEEVTPAPKLLRWNIHDDYALEHREMRRAAMRAEVLDDIDYGREIINLVTPSTTSTLDRP